MTTSSQLTRFQFLYEQMLNKLNALNMDVYILSDSNLNLLKFADHAPTNNHIDSQIVDGDVIGKNLIFDIRNGIIDKRNTIIE